jgi:hypothetical protein
VPDSVTVALPSARGVVRILAALVGLLALLLIGIAIGTRLLAPDPVSALATPGAIQQVGIGNGVVYVGRIVSSSGEYLQIAEPATIRQGSATPGASAAPQLVVEGLTVEPYDASGDLVIPIAAVQWVITVRSGSGLDAAYHQAIAPPGASPAPTSP